MRLINWLRDLYDTWNRNRLYKKKIKKLKAKDPFIYKNF